MTWNMTRRDTWRDTWRDTYNVTFNVTYNVTPERGSTLACASISTVVRDQRFWPKPNPKLEQDSLMKSKPNLNLNLKDSIPNLKPIRNQSKTFHYPFKCKITDNIPTWGLCWDTQAVAISTTYIKLKRASHCYMLTHFKEIDSHQ
jgi:hypothetical protein